MIFYTSLTKRQKIKLNEPLAPQKRAFTLIELLIVISIIAILATIIIVSFSNARVSSQTSVAKNTLQTFKKATVLYQNETGKLPDYTAISGRWCHPGYQDPRGTDICMGELRSTYLGDFNQDGPYGKCAAAGVPPSSGGYDVCYNYYVYGHNVMFSAKLNPIERTGPTNRAGFPSTSRPYCDPNYTGGIDYIYCDGYSY